MATVVAAGALAVPAATATPPSASPETGVFPTPQSTRALPGLLKLPSSIDVVAGSDADAPAVAATVAALGADGVEVNVVRDADAADSSVVVHVGTADQTPSTTAALSRLRVDGPADLPDEGYVLAAGRDRGKGVIVLSGVDDTGTFYAAQSFTQLLEAELGAQIRGVAIRDWPGYAVRGGMESFYGPVWSQADRVSQIEFLARHKMNQFFYGPADDLRTGSNWASLYPDDELARMKELVELARANHVDFVYRISPEAPMAPSKGICHVRPADRAKVVARFDQLWDIGIRTFVIAWDDVSGSFACPEDTAAYRDDASPLARAQAEVTNYVQTEFIEKRPGASRMVTVPTEYWGNDVTTYRTRFDDLLSTDVDIYWTGPQVVSPSISNDDVTKALAAFPKHRLMIWDNYPVNDYARNRLLVGPSVAREAGMEKRTIGITFNEMIEQAPSQIVLGTQADFAWNPQAYDHERAWTRTLRELGGNAYEELRLFAENNRSSLLDPPQPATMTHLVEKMTTDYAAGRDVTRTARQLTAEFARLESLPASLREELDDPLMLAAIKPWLDKLGHYGAAGKAAVRLLLAQDRGDGEAAWAARRDQANARALSDAIGNQVAAGPVETLLSFAATQSDGFIGDRWYGDLAAPTGAPAAASGSSLARAADRRADTVYVAARPPEQGEALVVPLTKAHPLDAVTIVQDAASPADGAVEVQRADGTWKAVGVLGKGYTRLPADVPDARAIRIAWAAGSVAPRIYEVSPRYADVLSATVTTDPDGGLLAAGSTARFSVDVEAHDKGVLPVVTSAEAPAGWTVRPDQQSARLRAHGRTLTRSFPLAVDVPESATGQHTITVRVGVPDGPAVEVPVTVSVGRRPDAPYAELVAAADPAAYWRLGESSGLVAHDEVEGGASGDYTRGAKPGAAGAVAGDTAADLATGYVEAPRTAATNLTGPFTVEAWIKLDSIAASPGQAVVESYTGPAVNGFALRVDNGRLQGWSLGASSYGLVTGRTTLDTGTWHHVALTHDGTRLTVYVDGVADGSVATSVTPSSGTSSIKLGARGDDAANQLAGDLDEVALYRSALSADAIAGHFLAAPTP
ncbi:beta-N-acetylglucosaminidase domain-containing protein [Mumia sp. DW29H23]|uniref:beta-N-acetylglucosaminidase domain-containing protein n=1 Tax=Mumia sp. DW29H23 TaxID=3421241 RepID=UPI003D693C7A